MGVREIIFRGKRVDNGEWVYGAYYKQEHIYGYEKVVHCIITSKDVLSNDLGLDYEDVIPETVGQYTGLNDKNGTNIFEGDIVRCYGGESCQGFWEYDETVVVSFADYVAMLTISELEYVEVIGNKWDNPELLKGEEE